MVSQCPQLTEEQSKSVVSLLCSVHRQPFNTLLGTNLCICVLIFYWGTLKNPPQSRPRSLVLPWALLDQRPSPGNGDSLGARGEMVQWHRVPELELLSSATRRPSRVLWAPKGLECLHGLQQQLCHPGNDPGNVSARECCVLGRAPCPAGPGAPGRLWGTQSCCCAEPAQRCPSLRPQLLQALWSASPPSQFVPAAAAAEWELPLGAVGGTTLLWTLPCGTTLLQGSAVSEIWSKPKARGLIKTGKLDRTEGTSNQYD